MRFEFIIMCFIWFFSFPYVFSQKVEKIDSLQQLLLYQTGIDKIQTLDELAWQLRNRKDSSGIYYALEGLQLSKQKAYNKGISDALNRLGGIAKNQKKFSQAKDYYTKALDIDKKFDYRYGIARAFNQLGLIYKKERKPLRALEYFLLSYEVFVGTENNKQISKVAGNLGDIYQSYQSYEDALKYYLKALEYSKLEGDSLLIAKSYKNLGESQKFQRNYKESLSYFKKAEKIYGEKELFKQFINLQIKIAAVYDYLNEDLKAKKTFDTIGKLIKSFKIGDLSAYQHNLATWYRKLKKKDSALYYYKKAIVSFQKKRDTNRLLVTYNNIGNLYYDNDQYFQSLNYLKNSLQLQKISKDSSLLEKTYSSISLVYQGMRNLEKAYLYKDSTYLVSKQNFSKIKAGDRYEVAYLTEKRKIESIKSKQKLLEAKTREKNILIIALIILLIVISVLFFYVTKSRRLKQKQLLSEYEKRQQQQHVNELIKAQEMNIINAMINGQEEERKRIAKELHDRLGSMLSVAKMYYMSVEKAMGLIGEDVRVQYEKANKLLDDSCKAVREISHNMLSGTLVKFGLISALEELKQTLEDVSNLSILLSFYKLDDRLENTMEIQLFRIIQELLNNILRHAQASQVDIQLLRNETGINILIEDDGVGFDSSKKYEGVGLTTIASRIKKMEGTYNIDSRKGNGTIVNIEIPI